VNLLLPLIFPSVALRRQEASLDLVVRRSPALLHEIEARACERQLPERLPWLRQRGPHVRDGRAGSAEADGCVQHRLLGVVDLPLGAREFGGEVRLHGVGFVGHGFSSAIR